MSTNKPVTVAATAVFERVVDNCMTEDEREAFVDWIARHPEKGDRVRGTGGMRKVRWGTRGRGRSGGLRVLYYYMRDDTPLYLVTVWDKSHKLSLTDAEKSELKKLAKAIKNEWSDRR